MSNRSLPAEPSDWVFQDCEAAIDRMASLASALKRLRDLVELGLTPCPWGTPHTLTGEESTNAVIEADEALRQLTEPQKGVRESDIERAARAVLDKIAAGGNNAVTVEDYRGFATDIFWLLGQLDYERERNANNVAMTDYLAKAGPNDAR